MLPCGIGWRFSPFLLTLACWEALDREALDREALRVAIAAGHTTPTLGHIDPTPRSACVSLDSFADDKD